MCYISFPIEDLFELVKDNMIVDVSKGGLVLGDRHSAGGIKIVQIHDNRAYLVGEMEGGEYIVNCFATARNIERLTQINQYNIGEVPDLSDQEIGDVRHYVVPPGHIVIKSNAEQAIINRSATREYLKEIDRLNESTMSEFDNHQAQI